MMTSETLPPSTPARLSASWIATLPSSWAGKLDKRTTERPNRGTGRADDDDIVLHLTFSMLLNRRPVTASTRAWASFFDSPQSPMLSI